jgi:hypothetical protein
MYAKIIHSNRKEIDIDIMWLTSLEYINKEELKERNFYAI